MESQLAESSENAEPQFHEPFLDNELLAEVATREVELMVKYLLKKGLSVPEGARERLFTDKVSELMAMHEDLSVQVAPATPQTIRYLLDIHRGSKPGTFRSIPLVRNFIVLAVISIVALIMSGLSSEVSKENLSKGILLNSGFPLLLNLIFLCSASAIGAVFYMLSKLTAQVKAATFDPSESSNYWARLIMGILSGLIMSEIIVLNQDPDSASVEMNRLLFALLGGFSSEAVYQILEGLIERIRTIMQ